jgi:uncharacterized membrane protein YgdD (TMEM256/DUF423 family)
VDILLFRLGCVLAGAGVALGAFGAHGLRAVVPPERLVTFETGVRYHLIHALAVILAAAAARAWPASSLPGWAGASFTAGILLFSGSLYLLVLTETRWLGAITPLGGVAFLAGWAFLALSAR